MIWIAVAGAWTMIAGVLWAPLGADLSPPVMIFGGGAIAWWALGQMMVDWRVARSRRIERGVDRRLGRA